MQIHNSITVSKLANAVERRMTTLDNLGFCVKCGHEQDGCEPDAQKYECEECGAPAVYGADDLLMRVA